MAHTLAALLIALLNAQTPEQSTKPPLPPRPKIELSAEVVGGAAPAVAARQFEIPSTLMVVYAYSATTVCSTRTFAQTRPAAGGSGWRVEIRPMDVPGIAVGFPITVTWQRAWEGLKELKDGKTATRSLFMMPDTSIVLDTIDGDAVRVEADVRARLTAWKPGLLAPEEVRGDVFLQNLQSTIDRKRDQKFALMRQNGYGETHPAIAAINDEITALAGPLNSRIKTLIDDYLEKLPTRLSTILDGCTATGMKLTISTVHDSGRDF